MSNISFTNPFLLLVGVALIVLTCIPFFLSVKKSGFNFHNITSLICHIIISILVTLSLAQMTLKTAQTKTTVYVLADVSYSSNQNLDKIDEYITNLDKNLPDNSEVGIICYGSDYQLLTQPGDKLKSVKDAQVDQSATNIKPALEYASSSFADDVIKRIVIISDGNETSGMHLSGLIKDFESRDIHVDAIYLDNNLKEDVEEVQLNEVVGPNSTYIDSDVEASVVINSNTATSCDINLYQVNQDHTETLKETYPNILLTEGTNTHIISLDTSKGGEFNYRFELTNFENGDQNEYNNSYSYSLNINQALKVLFIGSSAEDVKLYKENNPDVELTEFINQNVPYDIETLCMYDEYVLSNVNVSTIPYGELFVSNLEKCVSEYGKSLVTIGNTYIQNNSDNANSTLSTLSQMLPVKYDVQNDKNRLYTIILDISKSMDQISHLIMARQAAYSIIDLLEETDSIYVIAFYGDVITPFNVDKATPENKEKAKKAIAALDAKQATSLGAALNYAYESLSTKNYASKQVMLISDGLSYGPDQTNIDQAAHNLGNANIHVSTIYTAKSKDDVSDNLKNIASYGNGKYYSVSNEEEAKELVTTAIADEVTESYKASIDGFNVSVKKPKDELVIDLNLVKNVNDFYISNPKTTAQTIIEVEEKSIKYPLYSTWNYGEGKVSVITSSMKSLDSNLINRVPSVNKPSVYNYTPFVVNTNMIGGNLEVTITPPEVNSNAVGTLNVTYPYNSGVENKQITMSFNSQEFVAIVECNKVGTYNLEFNYSINGVTKTASNEFIVSYLPEYDSFEYFDSSNLYNCITGDGTVSEDGNLVISNEGLPVTYYQYEFAPVFLIISCILFVVDIAIRKLRWQDIKDLFKKKRKVEKK